MFTRLRALVLGVGLVSASLLMTAGPGAPPAGAITCTDASPCFAGVNWSMSPPSGTLGGKVTLRANCMTVGDAYQHTNTLALRVFDFDTNHSLEMGYISGYSAANDTAYTTPRLYWAYYATGSSGWSATPIAYAVTSSHTATIYKSSTTSSTWQMWFDNTTTRFYVPYMFSGAAEYMGAGISSTWEHVRNYSSTSRLYFYNLSATITPQWTGVYQSTVTPASAPQDADWADTHWWARMFQPDSSPC